MFTCSICDDTFVGVYQETTYTTRCGHVFHYQCLMTWLERSQTCPHCRSIISKDNIIKLFLQVDPNAQPTWNKKVDEEINSLRHQLQQLHKKETCDAQCILKLETELQQMQTTVEQNNKSIQSFNLEREHYNSKISELKAELEVLNLKNGVLNAQQMILEEKYSFENLKTKNAEKNLYELQSMNSVIIFKLKTEIADLKSEKGYLQSKCHHLENSKDLLPSTSELRIENNEVTSNEIQIKNEYYGHDPCLNLSSKYYLLGCVFLINKNQFEFKNNSICNNMTMYTLDIMAHGGSIDEFYSSRVTHIICTNQNDFLVQQSIRDKKRCVTNYWLSDTIAKENMSPPWLAHHFPTPFSKTNLPCQYLQVAIANFDVNECHRIKTMVKLTGAEVVDEVSSSTDVVISLKLEGQMVETALAINKPVVNVQWLNDILFGAKIGIRDPKNIKYQQFNLSNPFSVNYDMVSDLMGGWKTPVVYLKNRLVYDLTTSLACPSKRKRQKTDMEDPNCIDLINDDDDSNNHDLLITNINRKRPCIMFSGYTNIEQEKQIAIVLQLGGTMAHQWNEVTHLVMKQPFKTKKFLCCLSSVKQIINELWIKDSHDHKKFQDEKNYSVNVIYDDNNEIVCNVPKVLACTKRKKLFKSLTFFVASGIKLITPTFMEDMIKSAGGTVESNRKSLDSIKNMPPNTYFIISCVEDLHLFDDLLQINYAIYKPEFVMNSIMNQCIEIHHTYIISSATQN